MARLVLFVATMIEGERLAAGSDHLSGCVQEAYLAWIDHLMTAADAPRH